jgi:hypothetical protein
MWKGSGDLAVVVENSDDFSMVQQASRFLNGWPEQYPTFQSDTVATAMSTRKATHAVNAPIMTTAIHPEAASNRERRV